MCERVVRVNEDATVDYLVNCGDIIVATHVGIAKKSLIIDFKHKTLKAIRNGVIVELKLNPQWLLQELERHYFDEIVDKIVDSILPLLN